MQEIRQFATGEVVLREGDQGEFAYLIEKGQVSVTKDGPTGLLRLTTMGPGQMVGEISLLDDGPRIASVTALEPLTVRVIRKAELIRMLRKDAELSLQLLRIMSSRLRDSHRVIVEMQKGGADITPVFGDTAQSESKPLSGAQPPLNLPDPPQGSSVDDAPSISSADPLPARRAFGSEPNGARSNPQPPTGSASISIRLVGLTDAARNALDSDVQIIDDFPYLIGRDTRSSSADNDLWIPDMPPYQISRNHLAIILDRNQVLLTDRGSYLGFGLDGVRYGVGENEDRTAFVSEGDHTLLIGGEDSPYRFRMSVLKAEA